MQLNQPLPPSGKMTFQAKVTESITEGFTIETNIDGRPLKGILFSNNPNSYHPDTIGSSRKRAAGEGGDIILNGVYARKLKTPKMLKRDVVGDRQVDGVNGNASVSLEPHAEAAAVVISNIPAISDASHTHMESTNPEPVLPSLDLQNNRKSDALDSISGNPKDDRKIEVPSSTNGEVLDDDQTSDAQNHSTEVPKAAAAWDSMSLSQDQDDGKRTAEESKQPAKLIETN
ncbi:Kelch domain-containing protein 3 [Quillaja saponaria]|uniref:Kelch domain-containing protein 3 n=1 Tax=Quillaja saponaria TaxID=32244 RepID=A0AAD7PI61_QUISA|nr:Kelch domain-containing protein 3 [Quillaja saponaria]